MEEAAGAPPRPDDHGRRVSSKALLGQIVQEELPERLLRSRPSTSTRFRRRRSATGLGAGLFDENQHIEEELRRLSAPARGAGPQTPRRRRNFWSTSACVSQILTTWIAAGCAPNPIIREKTRSGQFFITKSREGRPARPGPGARREAAKRIGEQGCTGGASRYGAVVKSQAM